MELLKLLVSNYFIDVAVISWFSAQLIKTLLFYLQNGILQAERMVGAGGMPSAHSAFVCSITIAIAKKVGYSSPEFALALAFACVVMYDAMGVRRAAGEQAKVLNRMVLDLSNPNSLFALLGSHPERSWMRMRIGNRRNSMTFWAILRWRFWAELCLAF